MHKQLKIYWRLYEEEYSNEYLLKNFTNLMDIYHPEKDGIIADIGCGQSEYLIDFYKNSNHNLYAIDEESIQINALKRRIEKLNSNGKITYINKRFPNKEFINLKFSGVIISDVLHFLDLKGAKSFITEVEKNLYTGSILLITVHSWKHSKFGDHTYFKHYFKEEDFGYLLPQEKYKYLYADVKSISPNNKKIEFIKEWMKNVAHEHNIYDPQEITRIQNEYLNEMHSEEKMTIVVKKT
ncbi:methyltransferase domain-containing protein [Tenacibaculum sp.]|uniref:methyltransferase domain-containing protein n=1 Tax=Tenacibaculum sp. TaxID=1906242 RepID=UPI003D13643D